MYNIGDKVLYPMHGAGIIEAIEEKVVLKERRSYYVLSMPVGGLKVLVPTNNTDEIGLRSIIKRDFIREIMAVFRAPATDNNANWNKRYRENMCKIKSGDILELAAVVKSLMLRDRLKGLSNGERKMLNSAKQILASELILAEVLSSENDSLDRIINEIIDSEISAVN